MNRTTLRIDGMSCGHCVMSVRKALEAIDGVQVESVAVGTASVEFDPTRASTDVIVEAVNEAGYPAAAVA